jgi:hypothetical protein
VTPVFQNPPSGGELKVVGGTNPDECTISGAGSCPAGLVRPKSRIMINEERDKLDEAVLLCIIHAERMSFAWNKIKLH